MEKNDTNICSAPQIIHFCLFINTGIASLTFAVLPVFFQPVVVPAAALVMSHGDLHAVVFTAAVSDRAGVHR